jgi:hypothetical protein
MDFANTEAKISAVLWFESDWASLSADSGTAIFTSNRKQYEVGFTFADGRLRFDSPPSNHIVNLDLTFRITDQSGLGNRLFVKLKIGRSSHQYTFHLNTSFPIALESRLVSAKVRQLEIKNASDVSLFLSNPSIGEWEIPAEDSLYLIRPASETYFEADICEIGGIEVSKIWEVGNLPKTRLNAKLEQEAPWLVGVPIAIAVELPKGSYEFVPNDDFLVLGAIVSTLFAGGILRFDLVPLRVGLLQTPSICVNGENHSICPMFLSVTGTTVLSCGPLVYKS